MHVGLCKRERRLEGELLNHAAVGARVVICAITRAHEGFGCGFPGNPNSRSEIVAVRPHQRRRQARIPGQHRQHRDKPRIENQVHDLIVQLRVG